MQAFYILFSLISESPARAGQAEEQSPAQQKPETAHVLASLLLCANPYAVNET